MQPRILIATTTWWAMPARLALAFSHSGSEVFALCPRGSPIGKVQALRKEFRYRSIHPLSSLAAAIEIVGPDLIVPCDDRVVGHLHQLHEGCQQYSKGDRLRDLIETSLGWPASYPTLRSRAKLLTRAGQLGIVVPDTAVVEEENDLRRWADERGFPLVLKADGTWGGAGVRVAHSWAEAQRAFSELSHPLSPSSVLSHLSFHDLYPLFPARRAGHAELTVQQFIAGQCGNTMVACWTGKVLASLSVDVLSSPEALGASSVIRTRLHGEMDDIAELLVHDLGISGFCGLDFITERETGKIYLIELNPRATQLGHLRLGNNATLAHVLLRRLAGDVPCDATERVEETIAFFPQAAPHASALQASPVAIHYDVPSDDPGLLRELERPGWNRRHISALVYLALRRLLRLVQRPTFAGGDKLSSSKVKLN